MKEDDEECGMVEGFLYVVVCVALIATLAFLGNKVLNYNDRANKVEYLRQLQIRICLIGKDPVERQKCFKEAERNAKDYETELNKGA